MATITEREGIRELTCEEITAVAGGSGEFADSPLGQFLLGTQLALVLDIASDNAHVFGVNSPILNFFSAGTTAMPTRILAK